MHRRRLDSGDFGVEPQRRRLFNRGALVEVARGLLVLRLCVRLPLGIERLLRFLRDPRNLGVAACLAVSRGSRELVLEHEGRGLLGGGLRLERVSVARGLLARVFET